MKTGRFMLGERRGVGLLGIVLAVLLLALFISALVVSLQRFWPRVAVRVAGSWVAAIGMLMLGWLSHGVASAANAPAEAYSPWLVAPILTSNPKLGTSGGALAGYLYRFDEQSPVSTFGAAGVYSDTDSYVAGAFANTYFGADRHRLVMGAATGKVRNDYEDFLGSGLPVQTTDDLRFAAARYLHRFRGDWFAGVQFVATNYAISAQNWFSQKVLDLLGLTGFDSNAIGLVVQFDNTDNQNSPGSGQFFNIHNLAYRKGLGGDENFDVYTADYRHYLSHGNGHVLALRTNGRATQDAPVGGYSSVQLRGYVPGNYLAPHSLSLEAEERYRIDDRWGLAAFGGAACLLDQISDCGDTTNWYPAIGAGVIYTLKPKEKMVVRLDYARGEGENSGLYLTFGHPF
jgi:hypothetical protein